MMIVQFNKDLAASSGSAKHISDACTDMSAAYIVAVGDYMPSTQLSFDSFHVVARGNTGVDEVRREENQRFRQEGSPILTGIRHDWLAAPESVPNKRKWSSAKYAKARRVFTLDRNSVHVPQEYVIISFVALKES